MKGMILQAKYCFMPNKLGACGNVCKTDDLFEYAARNEADKGLEEILKTFEAAYPYLQFIAASNGIADPFDQRVVEAYWLGNGLLDRVDKKDFYNWCYERYGTKTDKRIITLLVGKVPMGALPHHSFHVFNSYLRKLDYSKVIHYINECRISAGKVTSVNGSKATAEVTPIELTLTGLKIGRPKEREVSYKFYDKGFVKEVVPGAFVTIHWGWICDVVTPERARALEEYTERQLMLFNDPI